MRKRLYLTEKPSAARALVAALGGAELIKDDRSAFPGFYDGKTFRVVYLLGHFYRLSEPSEHNPAYKLWRESDLPIIIRDHHWVLDATSDRISAQDRKKQIDILCSLYSTTSEVIIATDDDQEGQLIGQNVVEQTQWTGPTLRLHCSEQGEAALLKASENLTDNALCQGTYQAAYARTVSDLAIGVNYSRLFSLLAQKAGHKLPANVGRVKSPALAIVVSHTLANRNHLAASYLECEGLFQTSDGAEIKARMHLTDELKEGQKHCTSRINLNSYTSALHANMPGRIHKLTHNENSTPPPVPFSQSTLAQHMAEHHGWDPDVTLKTSQALYDKKFASYPRTESHFYETEVFHTIPHLTVILKELSTEFDGAIASLKFSQRPSSYDSQGIINEELSHGAIYVTARQVKRSDLSSTEYLLYSVIAMRMLVQFSSSRSIATTHAILMAGNIPFEAEGKMIVNKGWTEFEPASEIADALPRLHEGDNVVLIQHSIEEKKTKAPPRLTVASFTAALRDCSKYLSESVRSRIGKGQLGTGATQGSYMNELIKLNHIKKVDGKYLESTKLGEQLISLLPDIITSCDLTSLWELRFREIRKNPESAKEFMSQVWHWLEVQIEASKSLRFTPSPLMQPCPNCGCALNRIQSKKDKFDYFWRCSNYECNTSISDYNARPMKPLEETPTYCSECGEAKVTRLRKRKDTDTSSTERRYLICPASKLHKKKLGNEK